MKMTRRGRVWPLLVLALAGTTPSASAETAEGRMTRGKLAADLGDTIAAAPLRPWPRTHNPPSYGPVPVHRLYERHSRHATP